MSMCPIPLEMFKREPTLRPDPLPMCLHNCFARRIECQRYAAKPMTNEEISAHDKRLANAIAHRR